MDVRPAIPPFVTHRATTNRPRPQATTMLASRHQEGTTRGSRGAATAEAPSLFGVGGMVTCVLMTPLSLSLIHI